MKRATLSSEKPVEISTRSPWRNLYKRHQRSLVVAAFALLAALIVTHAVKPLQVVGIVTAILDPAIAAPLSASASQFRLKPPLRPQDNRLSDDVSLA